jgi:hypothetical protein
MATLNILKLCVGIQSLEHLESAQADKVAMARHGKGRLWHRTRNTPRRMEELLDGGSIYWVISGTIKARQRLIGFDHYLDEEGRRHCLLLLELKIVTTAAWPHRAFQGWRYLEAGAAPPDLADDAEAGDLPPEMARELRELGLL